MKTNQPTQATRDHSVADWLELHGVVAREVKAALPRLTSFNDITLFDTVSQTSRRIDLTAEEAWDLAAKALMTFSPDLSVEIGSVDRRCEKNFDGPETGTPFTQYHARNGAIHVTLCYRGTPEDILCVAHEFGHALQYSLSQERFIPPVERELAAFLAEKALLDYVHNRLPQLYPHLAVVWENDSTVYFGRDVKRLETALNALTSPYCYRTNYPLARFFAIEMSKSFTNLDPADVFRANVSLSALLSLVDDGRNTGRTPSSLPEISVTEKNKSALTDYRFLGGVVLLDIENKQGESKQSIGEYYSALFGYRRNHSALVAVGSDHRPIGYAIWQADAVDPRLIHLKRQTAPFGAYLALQRKVQVRLPKDAKVLAQHPRSARPEQITW